MFSEFGFKQYLDIILIAKYRYALTRLRTSSHRLAIETGRWTKPHSTPRFERKCQLCNTLEDEFHFMLECPLYRDVRVKYIRKYYVNCEVVIYFDRCVCVMCTDGQCCLMYIENKL